MMVTAKNTAQITWVKAMGRPQKMIQKMLRVQSLESQRKDCSIDIWSICMHSFLKELAILFLQVMRFTLQWT